MAYAVAAGLVAAALGLTTLIAPALAGHQSMLFFAAVAGAAWYGGIGPALSATVLSALSLDGLFRAHSIALGVRTHEDVLAVVLFGVVAVALSSMSEAQRRARRELTRVAEELQAERDQAQALATELEQQTEEAQALSEELEEANAEMMARVTETQEALGRAEESEHRFRLTANTAPVLIWSTDPLGACDWFNDPWFVFRGRPVESELGEGWLEGVHPEDRPAVVEEMRGALEARRPFACEFRLRRQDGSYRWMLSHAVPRHARDSAFLGYIGSCIDISTQRLAVVERDRLVAQLEAANAELATTAQELRERTAAAEAANRAKSDFLASMSHELRTPLNAIGGYAELLSMGVKGNVTQEQHEFLERISRSGRYLLRLINDILNFAKLEAGQVELHLENVSVDATLRGIEPLITPQLRARHLNYRYEACEPSTTAIADQEKLLQVMLNLVGNAIKFTETGGWVRVSSACEDHVVRIRVADTGRGIHPDRLARIFDPFVQLDRALTTPGSQHGVGLGLAISRDLVKQLGGEITVESTVGTGSTFTVTLPRAVT